MLENIKKRIIHFYTHGNIIEDFVEARRKKTAKLRRIIRVCFYIQCALAVCCIAAALLMGTSGAAAVIAGSIAVCVVAFIALGGGTAEKTILYILNLAYAVICFIVGGLFGSPSFIVCGVLMLLSAAAALGGFFAAWCRQYLLDFSPARITRSDYTRLGLGFSEPPAERERMVPPPFTAPAPPPPPKTEMEMLAEQLSGILSAIPDPKPVEKPEETNRSNMQAAPVAQTTETEPQPADTAENPKENTPPHTEAAPVAPAENPKDNSEQAPPEPEPSSAPSAELPDVVEISDVSVDFSIDG